MKFSKLMPHALTPVFFFLMAIASCQERTTIPVDPEKVLQHTIPIDLAIQYTKAFRETRTRLNRLQEKDSAFRKHPIILLNAEYFNRDAIAAMLNEVGPNQGIRIYLGQAPDGKVRLVMVPASRDRDIIVDLPRKTRTADTAGGKQSKASPFLVGTAIERGQECPEVCPFASPLLQ